MQISNTCASLVVEQLLGPRVVLSYKGNELPSSSHNAHNAIDYGHPSSFSAIQCECPPPHHFPSLAFDECIELGSKVRHDCMRTRPLKGTALK